MDDFATNTLKFDFSYDEWLRWKTDFEQFLHFQLEQVDGNNGKISILMDCLGDEGLDIFHFFESWQKTSYDNLLDAFDTYFSNDLNIIEESYKFRNMTQLQNEPIDDFFTRIEKQADLCDFQLLQNESFRGRMLRDQLVFGLWDDCTRNRLKKLKNPDIDAILDYCRRVEGSSNLEFLELKCEEVDTDTDGNSVAYDEFHLDEYDEEDVKHFIDDEG